MTDDPAPEYTAGDSVVYRGIEDNVWQVIHVEQGINCWWVRAKQNSVNQMFPAGVFTKHIDARPIEVPRVAKIEKQKVTVHKHPDHIAKLLAEARDIEDCITIARLAGIEVERDETKSFGLQRMHIGNLLRNKWKKGEFQPESIIWTNEHGFVTAP